MAFRIIRRVFQPTSHSSGHPQIYSGYSCDQPQIVAVIPKCVADIRINGHRQLSYRLAGTAEYGNGVPQK